MKWKGQHVSILDPWRGFRADTIPFKGPQPYVDSGTSMLKGHLPGVERQQKELSFWPDLGFCRDRAVTALRQCGNDIQSATVVLLRGDWGVRDKNWCVSNLLRVSPKVCGQRARIKFLGWSVTTDIPAPFFLFQPQKIVVKYCDKTLENTSHSGHAF